MPKLSDAALDARKKHILSAAVLCFARNGFQSTTIEDVKREAGVSTGAIYTYFSNKEEIVRAILEDARDQRRAQLARAVSRSSERGQAQALLLLEWVNAIFSERGRHEASLNVNLWAEARRSPSIGTLARQALAEANGAVSTVVSARLKGDHLDASTIASLLIATYLGLEIQTVMGVKLDPAAVSRSLSVLMPELFPAPKRARRATARTKPAKTTRQPSRAARRAT